MNVWKNLNVMKMTYSKFSKKNIIKNIQLPIQINGKTRDIIEVKKDINEEQIKKILITRKKKNT